MAKIRDGTIKEALEKLRRLSYEIEDINRRFDSRDRTGGTLDDFRVKVDRYEAEMVNLRRQVELGSAPSPPLTQQAGMIDSGSPFTLGNTAPCLGHSPAWGAKTPILSVRSGDTTNDVQHFALEY